jgi:hypothetical protein
MMRRGVTLPQRRGIEPEAREHTGAELLEQHIVGADHLRQGLLALRALQVEHGAALAAVQHPEGDVLLADLRRHVAQVVALPWVFDLVDGRPHVGEHERRERPREQPREVEHADVVERRRREAGERRAHGRPTASARPGSASSRAQHTVGVEIAKEPSALSQAPLEAGEPLRLGVLVDRDRRTLERVELERRDGGLQIEGDDQRVLAGQVERCLVGGVQAQRDPPRRANGERHAVGANASHEERGSDELGRGVVRERARLVDRLDLRAELAVGAGLDLDLLAAAARGVLVGEGPR